jgi:hypothetical protein
VGSINGGQASNLCTYIAKGDVALSVLMTTVTTIAGIFMTPLLCKAILGAVVPVDAVGNSFSIHSNINLSITRVSFVLSSSSLVRNRHLLSSSGARSYCSWYDCEPLST